MQFSTMFQRVAKLAADNSPAILTAVGVVGTISTTYLGITATIKVVEDIRTEEEALREVIPTRERFQYVYERGLWKAYIPMVGVGVATITAIIGANHIHSRRAAGLVAAFSIIEKSAEEYKSKVVEKLGERKELLLRDEINQERVNDYDYSTDDIKLLGLSDVDLCYDKFSDRFFVGSVEGIQSAVNSLNNSMNHDGYASLADLYRLLEMEAPSFSENIGWNHDRLLEVRPGSILIHNTRPAIVMEFSHDPVPDYGRFR